MGTILVETTVSSHALLRPYGEYSQILGQIFDMHNKSVKTINPRTWNTTVYILRKNASIKFGLCLSGSEVVIIISITIVVIISILIIISYICCFKKRLSEEFNAVPQDENQIPEN